MHRLRFRLAGAQPPIARLPVELLEIIFGCYAHSPEVYPSTYVLDNGTSKFSSQAPDIVNPMILSQVNQLWRQIALTLSCLWSRIYISHPTKAHVELAIRWLTLAGNSPLTLAVSSRWGKGNIDAFGDLLDVFISRYDTWDTIDFRVSHHFHSTFLRVPNYPPPLLRSVCFNCSNPFPPAPRDERAVDIFHSASSLQRVDWGASCYSIPEALEFFPNWVKLKHFVFTEFSLQNSLTINDCITLLHACPLLESFTVRIYPSDGRQLPALPSDSLPLTHPHLRILSVTTSPTLLSELFNSIILPALEGISIYNPTSGLDTSNPILVTAAAILHFLSKSPAKSCTLREFTLISPATPEHVILDLISSPELWNVRRMYLTGLKIARTLELLTRTRGNPESLTILPLLEHLTLYNHAPVSTLDASIAVIKRMVKSRTDKALLARSAPGTMSCLKYANLSLSEIDFWDYRRLDRLGSADFTIVPALFVPSLRDWISSRVQIGGKRSEVLCRYPINPHTETR